MKYHATEVGGVRMRGRERDSGELIIQSALPPFLTAGFWFVAQLPVLNSKILLCFTQVAWTDLQMSYPVHLRPKKVGRIVDLGVTQTTNC